MTKKITICFEGVRGDDMDMISTIRDFGEDLAFDFLRSGQAQISVEEVDAAVDRISFEVAPRFIGSAVQRVKQLLKKYHLEDIADIAHE